MRMSDWSSDVCSSDLNQLTDRQLAFDDQLGPEKQDKDADQLLDQLDALLADVGQAGDTKGGGDVASELVVPGAGDARINRRGLDRTDAVDRFDQEGLVVGATGELLVQTLAQPRRDARRPERVDRQRDDTNTEERRVGKEGVQ